MTIRSQLILLAIGAALPVLAFAILLSIVLVEQDRMTVRRGATDQARAMMSAVDAELRGSITTIEAITASPALQGDDLSAFRAEALRVLATQPSWLDITLSRPSGEKVLDALQGVVHTGQRVLDPASAARAARTRQVVVGNVDRRDAGSAPGVPIRVPVIRNGVVVYVLTALVRPESFQNMIREQRMPDGWVSGIVDASGKFVARIPAKPAGEFSSPAFRAAVHSAPEGWYRGLTVEGMDTFTAHERSDFSHWSIGLAIPAAIVEAGAWRTAWLMGIGITSSIAIALAITFLLGRRIAAPIVALASVARSIGSGEARTAALATTPTLAADGAALPPEETRRASWGGPAMLAGSVREVSDVAVALREADAAVRERQLLIEREKDALREADRAKDEFIAALSHELRNPLAALTAAAHVLRVADPTHAGAADARRVIDRQAKHMSRMIEDLLDMSRLIAGKANLMLETFDVGVLVASTVDAWRSAGRFAGQVVDVDAQSVWVIADRTRTEQIVSNLLDNAVKFTASGKTIAVRAFREGDDAVVSVVDEGEGMPAALVERVFDVFVQGDQDAGRTKGGIGVGLTLVKRLAELQGGSVRASSSGIGRGATLTVRLPATVSLLPIVPSTPLAHAASARSILIVEDNADARDMLREVLAMQGHDVCEAADGAEGIVVAAQVMPEVAIIDIGLPDVDGYEVARRIRSQTSRPIALIALTGYGQPADQRRALAAGFDLHLVKPITVERLDQAIATFGASPATLIAAG
jgi:signal transduction histidine kinase/ActR/RegA family two-component response regulator